MHPAGGRRDQRSAAGGQCRRHVETAQDPTAGLTASLVAPLPYAASQDGGITTIQDWGDVGPARQTDSYTYTAAPAQPAALPAFGRVDLGLV